MLYVNLLSSIGDPNEKRTIIKHLTLSTKLNQLYVPEGAAKLIEGVRMREVAEEVMGGKGSKGKGGNKGREIGGVGGVVGVDGGRRRRRMWGTGQAGAGAVAGSEEEVGGDRECRNHYPCSSANFH